MASIVAGTFDTEAEAERALAELRQAGVGAGDLDTFDVSPPGRHDTLPLGGDEQADPEAKGGGMGAITGAVVGTAVGIVAGLAAAPLIGPAAIAGGLAAGAYVGSMAGAVNTMGDHAGTGPRLRPAGVLVAVHTASAGAVDVGTAIDRLRSCGARMIERATGAWQNGKWTDFDPVLPPDVIEAHAA